MGILLSPDCIEQDGPFWSNNSLGAGILPSVPCRAYATSATSAIAVSVPLPFAIPAGVTFGGPLLDRFKLFVTMAARPSALPALVVAFEDCGSGGSSVVPVAAMASAVVGRVEGLHCPLGVASRWT